MGDAIVADVDAHPRGAARGGRRSPTAPGARAERPARRKSRADRPAQLLDRPRGARPRSSPRTAIVVLESPSSTLALRNQLRLSRPGSYYFSAGGGLGFGLAASVGVQLAQPDRPVVCVLGEGSAQYAITAFWSAVAYDVPVTFLVLRNEEYAILKWFAEVEQVERRARPRPAGARRRRGRRAATASTRAGSSGRDEVRDALATALASSRPELVEVPVAPGMSLF